MLVRLGCKPSSAILAVVWRAFSGPNSGLRAAAICFTSIVLASCAGGETSESPQSPELPGAACDSLTSLVSEVAGDPEPLSASAGFDLGTSLVRNGDEFGAEGNNEAASDLRRFGRELQAGVAQLNPANNGILSRLTRRHCTSEATEPSSQLELDEAPVETGPPVEDTDTDTDTGTGTETGTDFDPAGETSRDQLVSQFESIGLSSDEAACIADSLDFSDPAVQSGDVAAMLDVFEECDIGLDRLAELGGGQ